MSGIPLAVLLELSDVADKERLRFEHSYEQGFDSSCGLSALACLMSLYWNAETDEEALAESVFGAKEAGDYTVSFADLVRLLEKAGFAAAAYRLDYAGLVDAAARYAPILVHYDKPEPHFALVLHADASGLVTADPAEGTRLLDRAAFEARWSGAALFARSPGRGPDSGALREAADRAAGRARLLETAARASARGR